MGQPIRTRKRKLAARVKHDARLGRVVQVKERGGGNPYLSSAGKKSFLTMMKQNRKRKRKKRTKKGTSQAERAIQVMMEARQHQHGNE